MSNAMSCIATAEEVLASHQGAPAPYQNFSIIDAMNQLSQLALSRPEGDQFMRFPAEVRIMIYEELLSVWPHPVFRGAFTFGPIDPHEFDGEMVISWQILATCRLYYEEAYPILYSKNHFIFCTGAKGNPGMFWRFPIATRYMPFITNLSIFYRADEPTKQASKRVGHFMLALARLAVNLEHLTVLISSDQRYEQACPWDIIFCDHPVAKAIVRLVENKTVKNLRIRLHDGARLFPGFACHLDQTFMGHMPVDRTLIFTMSCSCAPIKGQPSQWCSFCQWPRHIWDLKPIEDRVHPVHAEAGQSRMMDMQADLFELGILPPKDDTDEEEKEEENVAVGGGGGGPPEDTYEEDLPAFTLGVRLPPRKKHPFRTEISAPAVWSFEQTKITNFYGVA
ncbi:hypothetical protein T440DRAFT_283785 [Plenodomus tracheiphilus IPT5]|uniref:Uncharacterized protein n=1 Tax=Plenodomus tracheiphilus IPT5 TaxID=1408161 RepID=A0A6A7ASA9_9PLEO|nr:hypothetical protein T440DRAFT_283785 [Plenodomus tracheiphilus IPT5]